MRYSFFILIIVFTAACSGGRPKSIIPPEKMQAVLWDFMQAEVLTTDFIKADSTKNLSLENSKLQTAIFKQHKVSREEFYKSYHYYETHPSEFRGILDTIIERKGREQVNLRNESAKKILPVDSM